MRHRPFSRRHVLTVALSNPLGTQLHANLQLVLLHVAERLAQLAGRASLRAGEVPDSALHVLLKPIQLVQHAFPLTSQFLVLPLALPGLQARFGALLTRWKILLKFVDELLLLGRELIRAAREIAQLIARFLLP